MLHILNSINWKIYELINNNKKLLIQIKDQILDLYIIILKVIFNISIKSSNIN